MELSYKTYDANRGEIVNTILHWQRILKGEEPATGYNCPFCQKYNSTGTSLKDSCEGCPIYEVTEHKFCTYTPFTALSQHHQMYHHDKPEISNDCPICEDLIKEELKFLRSLHPFKPGDNVQITCAWTKEENKAYNIGTQHDIIKTGVIERLSEWGNCRIAKIWYPPVVLALIPPHKSLHKSQPKAQISYKQVIVRGEKKILITGFYRVLKIDDLPTAYMDVSPYFYKKEDTRIYSSKYDYINVGDVYSVQRFDDIMAHLHECSARLHTINEQLQIENAGWEGVEKTIDI